MELATVSSELLVWRPATLHPAPWILEAPLEMGRAAYSNHIWCRRGLVLWQCPKDETLRVVPGHAGHHC